MHSSISRGAFSVNLSAVVTFFTGILVMSLGAAEDLIPANFQQRNDSHGLRWDISPRGSVEDGSNDCFDGGFHLQVDGNDFHPQSQMMTKDGLEYVLTRSFNNIQVTRRVRLDLQRGAVRYLEVFQNTDASPRTVSISIRTQLGNNATQTITDAGAVFGGNLPKNAVGVCALAQGNRPSVMFLIGDARAEIRPTIQVNNNRQYTITYSLTLPPGETKTILHIAAQHQNLQPQAVPALFETFYKRRLLSPEIPRELRNTVVNFSMRNGLDGSTRDTLGLLPIQELVDLFGVERGADDILVMTEDSHLSGTVEGNNVSVETRRGVVNLPLEDVAALQGGGGVGRRMRVYLRNGEVLVGHVGGDELFLRNKGGLRIRLDPSSINTLILHARQGDGLLPDTSITFARFLGGERLLLGDAPDLPVAVALPWGEMEVPLKAIQLIERVRETQPLCRISLASGSRVTGVLHGKPLTFQSDRFGKVEAMPQMIGRLVRLDEPKPESDAGIETPEITAPESLPDVLETKTVSLRYNNTSLADALAILTKKTGVPIHLSQATAEALEGEDYAITLEVSDMKLSKAVEWVATLTDLQYRSAGDGVEFYSADEKQPMTTEAVKEEVDEEGEETITNPHFLLSGENLLVGALEDTALTIYSAAGAIDLDAGTLRRIEREDAGNMFSVHMADGTQVSGTLSPRVIGVRAEGALLRIPVEHIRAYIIPDSSQDTVPDGEDTDEPEEAVESDDTAAADDFDGGTAMSSPVSVAAPPPPPPPPPPNP